MKRMMSRGRYFGVGFVGGMLLVVGQLLLAQQDVAQQYEALTLSDDATGWSERLRECATTLSLLQRTATGVSTATPLADGRPLRADQFPRFLRPTHQGDFGFYNFLILGDHEVVTFRRRDPNTEEGYVIETWVRTGTDQVDGRLVSVFNPTWTVDLLHESLRRYSWGVDRPRMFWGELVIPSDLLVTVPSDVGITEDQTEETVNVFFSVMPPNIPTSEIIQVNEKVQFASHAVNIFVPEFGDTRVHGGDSDFGEHLITRMFYEYFDDVYDVVAVMSQATQFTDFSAFHGNVQNAIKGIGLSLFDNSWFYGSAGVLKAVEGYPPGGWATLSTVLHEQGHQYGEYTNTWKEVGPPLLEVETAIDRKGHKPSGHTPLLYPGAFTYGAVLEGGVRVTEAGGEYSIERTTPLVTYNPLTLYRMGLISPEDLPTYQVFLNQGQFNEKKSVVPDLNAPVEGGSIEVTVNDMLAADGVRAGPVVDRVKRALVYVSRSGLVPPEEMHVVNYFAKRLGEASGVTTYDRFPSFTEATGGQSIMTTDIDPRDSIDTLETVGVTRYLRKIEAGPEVYCAKIGTHALIGFAFDEEIGGCVEAGTTVKLEGSLTLTDRTDYTAVCFKAMRYGDSSDDGLFVCGSVNGGNRFNVEMFFPANRPGGWKFSAYAFFPDSGAQYPRSTYTGGIEVLPQTD